MILWLDRIKKEKRKREEKQGGSSFTGSKRRADEWDYNIKMKKASAPQE